ncbi:hypothetical protein MCHI_000821 [Candidatus Magnetoovum chiemensis]|nr:hypothetical protein MCHI_000821 [Candidatus Magnetoovum chiemensis]
MKYYLHITPGRLRVRIPNLKGNKNVLDKIGKICRGLESVEISKYNMSTGSIVITYNKKTTTHDEILDALRTYRVIDLSKTIDNDQYIKNAILKAGKTINKALVGSFFDKAFEGTALSFLSILI